MPAPLTILLTLGGAAQVISGLKAVEGAAASFVGVLGSLATAAGTITGALGGVRDAIRSGGELADMSARLGASVGDLVILRRALDLVGASAGALPPAITAFQRSLSGINEEGSSTADVFGKLGLSITTLRTLPLAEQLAQVSAKLQAIPSQADRVALAMKLFGRGGGEILPMLVDPEALAQATREAGGLAQVMARNAAAFDRVGDQVGAVKLRWQEVNAIVAERTLPLFESLAKRASAIDPLKAANALERSTELAVIGGAFYGISKLGNAFAPVAQKWGEQMLISTNYGTSKVRDNLATGLIGLQGSLAKILPIGLAAAVAIEIGLGIYQARMDAKNRLEGLVGDAALAGIERIRRAKEVSSKEELDAIKKANAADLERLAVAEREIRARGVPRTTKRNPDPYYTPEDRAKLKAINAERQPLNAVVGFMADDEKMAKIIAENVEKQKKAIEAQVGPKRALFDLETQLVAAQAKRDQPEIDRIQRLIQERKYTEDLNQFGSEGAALVQQRLAAEEAARTSVRKEQRDSFALATDQAAAELAANHAEENRLKLLALEKQLRIELEALGAGAESEVQRRVAIERARLDRESALAILKAKATTAEAELSRVEQQRSAITGSTILDEMTKRQRLTANTEEYRQVLAAVLELKLQERKLAVDQAEQAALDAEIASLRARGATYGANDLQPTRAARAQLGYDNRANPVDHYQTSAEGVRGGAQDFVSGLGTAADNAAEAVQGTLNTALSSTSDFLYDIIGRAQSFKEAWTNASAAVGQQFLRMATDMVAKMIWRSTIERMLIRVGVIEHTTGEQMKTGASLAGAAIRIGTTIKEALASVYHGALEAFRALAGIPYAGPFLAAAAMAAAIAGGLSLVGKIGHFERGGIIGGGRQIIQVNENGTESVLNASATRNLGPAAIAALNAGASLAEISANAQGALAARGAALQGLASATSSSSGGGAPALSPNVGVSFAAFNNQQHAQAWLESQAGERYMVNFLRRRGFKNG